MSAAGSASGSEGGDRQVRTRFAPSPTGRLHLGNLRIAAFNWLFARHHGGAFVLRIEDTDVERNVEGAEALVLDDLLWMGLEWDEGPDRGGPHAPYRQSERGAVYRESVGRLLSLGRAYPCWCTEAELDEGREQVSGGEVLRYSGRCRDLSPAERASRVASGLSPVIRFAVPGGDDPVVVEDAVRGPVSFPASDLTDFVIQRADGTPTYNFAVVADDVDMRISHVIRGAGHLSNTPRQALLFDALGWARPVFAHLPTVLAPGGGKLSKRTGSAGTDRLRAEGYNPDGVLNYLSLLGWSAADEREVMTREELVERISLERVGRSDTVYDPEKLRWISGQHVSRLDTGALVGAVRPFLDRERIPLSGEGLVIAVETVRTRISTYGEVNEHLAGFFPADALLEQAGAELRSDAEALGVLEFVGERLKRVATWDRESLRAAVVEAGKALGVRGPGLYGPLRRALTGEASGPDLAGIMASVGRAQVLSRVAQATGGSGGRSGVRK